MAVIDNGKVIITVIGDMSLMMLTIQSVAKWWWNQTYFEQFCNREWWLSLECLL